jgi:hypothetical protein
MIDNFRGIEHYKDQFTPADMMEAQMYINHCIDNNMVIDMTEIDDERLVGDLLTTKLVLIERIRRKDELSAKKK